ncbi:hypothetical protein [Shimia thalassica]|uniref:hypothetical protein n=1 Tax=Shimia thalassica TaxID=1715693 RepID=UPI0027331864|nr:hypothetical protein [Shimia thalassica]MDP2518729.1 hypothetical protein [Shimia thalassica]
MIEHVLTLGQSDACGGWPPLWQWLTVQAAHVLIGAVVALHPRLFVAAFTVWIGKELFFDLPHCSWTRTVQLDSLCDITFGLIGAMLTAQQQQHPASP